MNLQTRFRIDFGVKLRRIFAWIIDGMAIFFLTIVLAAVISVALEGDSEVGDDAAMAIIALYLVGFGFRDPIFGGRSIGKRLFRLGIVDSDTGGKPQGIRWVFRGILFPLYFFDGMWMLVSDLSFGDRLGRTAVLDLSVAKNLWFEHSLSQSGYTPGPRPANTPYTADGRTYAYGNTYSFQGGSVLNGEPMGEGTYSSYDGDVTKSRGKQVSVLLIVAIILIFIVLVFSIVFETLNKVKDSEQYRAAYEYLIYSDYFEASGASEDDVELRGYKIERSLNEANAEFTFNVKGETVVVYCHLENGRWIPCEECSRLGGNRAEINEMKVKYSDIM